MQSQRFEEWLGKQEVRTDLVAAAPIRRLAALLDHERVPWHENTLPPLGHWLFHLSEARQSTLGPDGHPQRGGFMPPIPLPRRLWGGSRIRFLQDISFGVKLTRRSTIERIDRKTTHAGEIVLVTVRHELAQSTGVAIEEEQTIVYAGGRAGSRPRVAPEARHAQVRRRYRATPDVLFRFSALTFNAHRIHYDRDYAQHSEHYPGLVVHGPLLATLLVDHFLRHRPGAGVLGCTFRTRAPSYDGDSFDLCLAETPTGADLWVRGVEDGEVRMTAQIDTAP